MVKQIPLTHTGTSKGSELDELRALLYWPGLYTMAAACDEYLAMLRRRTTGRKPMPTAVLLFTAAAARVTGSLASAVAALSAPTTWEALREVWEVRPEVDGQPFPAVCPNLERVKTFCDSLVRVEYWCKDCSRSGQGTRETPHDCFPGVPNWHDFLQDRFQVVAIRQAQHLGHLRPVDEVDWTKPQLANTIVGDGTVVTPFSDVRRYKHPVTGVETIVGSRAADNGEREARPRLSPGSDLRADGKSHLAGLNMVSMLTPTEHGWVVLGTGYAPRAEQWAALDLLDSIASKANGGVHNLLWDRVFTGWLLDCTLGEHGIRVFNKAVAAPKRKKKESSEHPADDDEITLPESEVELRRSADELLERINSGARFEIGLATLSDTERAKWRKHELAALGADLRNSEIGTMYQLDLALPLGISVYKATSASAVTGSRNQTNRGSYEIVRSRFRRVGAVTHLDGTCQHVLYTDDGGLHSVEFDGTHLVKRATARCLSSKLRTRGAATPSYGTTETWSIPCEHEDLTFITDWDPSPTRHTPDTPEELRKATDPVLNDLRPISRHDERAFADIANARNNAESYNNWYKNRLPRPGRAASLHRDPQLFDYLCGAMVRNAITWRNWVDAND